MAGSEGKGVDAPLGDVALGEGRRDGGGDRGLGDDFVGVLGPAGVDGWVEESDEPGGIAVTEETGGEATDGEGGGQDTGVRRDRVEVEEGSGEVSIAPVEAGEEGGFAEVVRVGLTGDDPT